MSKKLKVAVIFGTVTSLFLTSLATVNAGKFTDVGGSETYMKGIEFLADQGIVNGNPDGSYKPANTLNRAEMVKIIAEGTIKLNDGDASVFEAYVGADCFSDVPSDAWFTKYVCYAKEQGWVKGYEGNKFKPTQEVNFAESLKITFKGFGIEYAEDSDPWFKDLVVKASDSKYIPQTINGFSNGLKRGEMADMVSRIIKKDEGEESLDEYLGEWSEAVVTYETIDGGIDISEMKDDYTDNGGNDTNGESDGNNNKVSVDASGFSADANYKGTFPAPEGMVLEGKYGEDEFQPPTGPGPYRYQLQTAFQRNIVCLDSTRTLTNSKGGKYDEGFYAGHNMADIEAERLVPVYDETPRGTSAGNSLYDEAYKAAYNFRWSGGPLSEVRRDCPRANLTAAEIAYFDKDGWYKNTAIKNVDSIKELYTPPMALIGDSSQSVLGGESVSADFSNFIDAIKDSEFNEKKDPVNVHRIDILELESEKGMDLEKDLMDFFNETKEATYVKHKNTVAFIGEPSIETKTYGKNTVSSLTFVTANDGKWYVAYYVQRQDPKTGNVITLFFYDPLDTSNETKDDFDLTKTPNVEFVSQFLEKIVFTNY